MKFSYGRQGHEAGDVARAWGQLPHMALMLAHFLWQVKVVEMQRKLKRDREKERERAKSSLNAVRE